MVLKNKILTGIFSIFLAGGIARGEEISADQKIPRLVLEQSIVEENIREEYFIEDLNTEKDFSKNPLLIETPRFNWLEWPIDFYTKSDMNFQFPLNREMYLRGTLNMKYSIENPNFIIGFGYSYKTGINVEFFCNAENNTIGFGVSNRSLGSGVGKYLQTAQKVIKVLEENIYR